jgi:hypothetical protein
VPLLLFGAASATGLTVDDRGRSKARAVSAEMFIRKFSN